MNKYKIAFISENLFLIGLVVAAIIMGVFKDGKKPSNTKSSSASFKKEVQIVNKEVGPIQTYISAHGRVMSSEAIELATEVQGKIQKAGIELKVGADFTKGQLLFSIDNDQAYNAVMAKRAGFLRTFSAILAELKMDFSSDYAIWQKFYDQIDIQKTLPRLPKLNNSKLKTYLAKNNILTDYYSIQADEDNLSKFRVYAPYNGSITTLYQNIGNRVNPGTPVIRIIKTDAVEVNMPIEAKHRSNIQIGNEVKFYAKDNQQSYNGMIKRIGDVINPNSQSVDVFIEIQSENEKIYEGMYLMGEIFAENIDKAIEIPRTALSDDQTIFLVKDSAVLEFKPMIYQTYQKKVIVGGFDEQELSVPVVLDASEVRKGEIVSPFQIGQ